MHLVDKLTRRCSASQRPPDDALSPGDSGTDYSHSLTEQEGCRPVPEGKFRRRVQLVMRRLPSQLKGSSPLKECLGLNKVKID